jgi:hypothetical protein
MNPVIPAPVPVPLPAPVWLVHLLQIFTFVWHLLLMNTLVGGGVMLAISSYLGRRDPHHRDLVHRLARVMPPVIAFTITLGIPPLLFLQLLYGQLFYTSSVLMAWTWLAVVLLLMVAYYGIYWFNFRQEALGARGFWVTLVTALILVRIMLTYNQNMSLLERPQDFYPRFLQTPVGHYLGSFDVGTLLRFAHTLVAAFAVAGLGLMLLTRVWRAEAPELAAWAQRYGLRWFLAGTGVQFLVGPGYLFSLPVEIRNSFLGADTLGTAILAAALVLAVLAMVMARRSPVFAAVAIAGTVGLMVIIRHLVRLARLRPYFDPHTLPVQGQWVVFAIFVVLLLGGLATVGWMLYKFFRPASARATSA